VGWATREQRNRYQRAYRLKRGVQPRAPRVRIRITCLVCGKAIGRNSTGYCSITCQHAAQYSAFIERWLRYEVDGGTVSKVSG
jgi:hypothetical protein